MCCVSLPTPASNCLLRQCCGPCQPFNIVVTDSQEREVCVFVHVCGGSGCGRWNYIWMFVMWRVTNMCRMIVHLCQTTSLSVLHSFPLLISLLLPVFILCISHLLFPPPPFLVFPPSSFYSSSSLLPSLLSFLHSSLPPFFPFPPSSSLLLFLLSPPLPPLR